MGNSNKKHKKNIDCKWYCTDPEDDSGEGCIACNLCYSNAPDFFKSDEEGFAYIKKCPKSQDEISLVKEQMEICPVSAIGFEE